MGYEWAKKINTYVQVTNPLLVFYTVHFTLILFVKNISTDIIGNSQKGVSIVMISQRGVSMCADGLWAVYYDQTCYRRFYSICKKIVFLFKDIKIKFYLVSVIKNPSS